MTDSGMQAPVPRLDGHRRFRFPGLRILDWYIIKKFLGTYVFAIALIIVIVVIFDAVEKIDDFIELKAPCRRSSPNTISTSSPSSSINSAACSPSSR